MAYSVGWSEEGSDDDDRGDWLACVDFDVSLSGNYVGYHVVVNSDSGGFIDTLEKGVYTMEEACNALPSLLDYWCDIAGEHLAASNAWFTPEEERENRAACEKWKTDIENILTPLLPPTL